MATREVAVFLGLVAVVSGCGLGYSTWYDGWCYKIRYGSNLDYSNAASSCAQEGSLLPSIKDQQENDAIMSSATKSISGNVFGFHLGLSCNASSGEFYWQDGTIANYTNFYDNNTVCDSDSLHFYLSSDGTWVRGNGWGIYYIACRSPSRSDSICDDFSPTGTNAKSCHKLQTDEKDWTSAEQSCTSQNAHLLSIHDQTTNDYFRRAAIGAGLVNGLHIGLSYSRNDGNYSWSDGTDDDYDNFAGGFPDTAYGSCVAMQTGFMAGSWMNTECYNTRLPFVCSRPSESPNTRKTRSLSVFTPPVAQPTGCPVKKEYRDGDDIYSPSFPLSGGAAECEYVLLANQGQRVQLEVVLFESNLCCDRLDLFNGLFGNSVLASLNGFVSIGQIYTSSSNAMRMVWNATNPSNTRGFHLKMRSV